MTDLPDQNGPLKGQLEQAMQSQPVDDTLLSLNETIEATFKQYFHGTPIRLRFDIPDKEDPPGEPTLCVFLYDLQEDLELRHGQARQYQADKGIFLPGRVHVRCCYLITYWEPAHAVSTGPRSQSMEVMNLVLNALLNMRPDVGKDAQGIAKPTFSRVITPSEHLSSLGNFWQSLGDRPRLCLNYSVTIPIELLPPQDKAPPVRSVELTELTERAPAPADRCKHALIQAMKPQDAATREQLDRLQVSCEPLDPHDLKKLAVTVSGVLSAALKTQVESTVKSWEKQSPDKTFIIKQTKIELIAIV